MMPLPTSDHGHHTLADSVLFGQGSLSFFGCRNFSNLRIGQLSAWSVAGALLFDHVQRVVAVRAKPKMIRVDAQPDIATMANASAIRDWAFVGHVGSTMGEVSMPAVFDLPIVTIVLPRVEDAATFLLRGSFGKSLSKRIQQFGCSLPECRRHAVTRAKLRSVQVRWAGRSDKSARASNASKCFGGHITLYHWSLNGYPDRLARWDAAKETFA